MDEEPRYEYDVFVSYSSKDKEWVRTELLPRLEKQGLRAFIDFRDFKPGSPSLVETEHALRECRKTLLVLTPAYLESEWCEIESIMSQTRDPANRDLRLIPLLRSPCARPARIASLTHVDFTAEADLRLSWDRLLQALKPPFSGKRVCFLSSEYPPHVLGGLGVHVEQLTAALAEHWDVDVVLPTPVDEPYASPPRRVRLCPITDCYASYDDPTSWLEFAKKAVDEVEYQIEDGNKPDIIHCHDWVTALAGIICRWQFEIPMIYHVHLPNKKPFSASLDHLGRICADLVTVNSKFMRSELNDLLMRPRKLKIVRNGVDVDAYHPCDDWPNDDDYILFVGRLVEQKGVVYLLRAFSLVHQKFSDIRLKIVGKDIATYEPSLKRLAENLLVGPYVDFLGEQKGWALQRLYQRARIVTVPSIYEPFGMTALEGMACARPVVASEVGGLKETIAHGETGFLCRSKDHLDLAQWIMALLHDGELRKKIGDEAVSRVRSEYEWSSIAHEYLRLYDKLLQDPMDTAWPDKANELKYQLMNVADKQYSNYGQGNEIWSNLFRWM